MKRNSQLESCVLESDGDTEEEEDSDGKLARTAGFPLLYSLYSRDSTFEFSIQTLHLLTNPRDSFSESDSNEDTDRDGQRGGAEDSGSGSWWRCVLQ